MKKVVYYSKRFGYNLLPSPFFKNRYLYLKKLQEECDTSELEDRLNYYFKLSENINIPEKFVSVGDFKRDAGTDYYLDFSEFLHFFNKHIKFSYYFGDSTKTPPNPTILKARMIDGENANSILFKLNKNRHFIWVDDKIKFADKKNLAVWRGGAYLEPRKTFVKTLWNNHLCNVGQTNKPKEDVTWQKDFLSIDEQLQYKFIFCPEGNDVATNLKWVLSSNSLCFMQKPKNETWFMEGKLKAGIHYVELNQDYSNFEDKALYYSSNIEEAEAIIKNANDYTKQFQNQDFEDILCLLVLEKYAKLSNQKDIFKYNSPKI